MDDFQKYNLDEILPLITVTELRDAYTQGHSQRVAYYAHLLATALNLDTTVCQNVYTAGLLHDIGKIGIPDAILLKPGQLDKEEFELIKLHSSISGQIVKNIPHYKYLANIVASHHENYDGSGYPQGLKKDEIPLEARLLSIADVFDALTTRRIYRSSLSFEQSLTILKEQKYKFDPYFLETFLKIIPHYGITKAQTKTIHFEKLEKLRNNFFFIDPLTKTLNRDGLLAILGKLSHYQYKLMLYFLNIKNFKEYNYHFGSQKGDQLLIQLTKLFYKTFTPQETIKEPQKKDIYFARIQADQFIFISIEQRENYLTYKLEQMIQQFQQEFQVEIKTTKIIKNSHNIKSEIGYLL